MLESMKGLRRFDLSPRVRKGLYGEKLVNPSNNKK